MIARARKGPARRAKATKNGHDSTGVLMEYFDGKVKVLAEAVGALDEKLDRVSSAIREEAAARGSLYEGSIRELFVALRAMNARFDRVDARFDAVDARFDALDARFDRMDRDLTSLRDDGGGLPH
jgi:hypothetical protein